MEIARLALWLHTARGDKPLSSLDENIREGNSLIGSNFYKGQINLALYDDMQKERVNAFDWEVAFPSVFARNGFDAVVGNPPYVKLQNFRKVHADMAIYLREGRPSVGVKPYRSTGTGNFDLYLPFIEKGISLLNEEGRLGFIAPSLWTSNEYGEGLQKLVAEGRNLDRWIDFKAFQVFEESITYTALQFFTKKPNDAIRVAEAPTGEIPDDPWADPKRALPYGRQAFGERWLLLTGEERTLIDRLCGSCKRLDDPVHTSHIFVGLQTSADEIYHLTRIAPGRYLCTPKGEGAQPPYEVEIETALMKPLISGPEAKRYVQPTTETYLLFPYRVLNGEAKLISAKTMQEEYPKAWAYLNSYYDDLRLREAQRDSQGQVIAAPFDGQEWYRLGRHQNLEKQEVKKLIVAQTVPKMRVCYDDTASMYLNNVRVNGIIAAEKQDPWFLLGVLNSRVIDFVFRRIGKVKVGGFFEANKQFIAPLPIPTSPDKERTCVASRAKTLQQKHTLRRDVLAKIERRLSSARTRKKPETWLFPLLKSERDLISEAPIRLDAEKRREWTKQRYSLNLSARYDAISNRLLPGSSLSADFKDGELSVSVDSVPIIDRIFVGDAEGEFVAAQWKLFAATFTITEKTDGKKLANALRSLVVADNPDLVQQIVALEAELTALDAEIASKEKKMNRLINRLYGLSDAEAKLIGGA